MARAGLLLAVLIGLGLVGWRFVAHHGQVVTVDLWLRSWDVPLWLALGVAFVSGAVLASVFALYGGLRLRLTQRRYRKTVAALESEIHQLRNLPLAPEGSAVSPTVAEGREARRESGSGRA